MIESQNQAVYKYSDVFASGVGIAYGVVKTWADTNRYGDSVIRLSDIDYKNFLWDDNSVEYEHNDSIWMAEKRYIYRVDARRQWDKKLIDEQSIGDAATRWGRKKSQYYVNYNRDGNSDLDLLTILEHYHKVNRAYYTVLFGANVIGCVRTKKEAETILRKAQLPLLEQDKDLPPADIIKTPRLMLDKYLFTYTDILEFEETDMEDFPYSIYQAFQFKNKIWTMSDVLKSMQQLANRMLQQMDYAIGIDVKNNYEMVMPNIEAVGLSREEAIKALKEDHIVPVGASGTFNPIKSQGFNPQYAELMQIMIQLIDEQGGGKTFSGNPNSGHQSGKAINSLIGQGQLLADKFIDNRNRFLQDLGRKTIWFMKHYDNTPYVQKIEGGSLSKEMLELLQQESMYQPSKENPESGYVKMNQDGMNYLQDAEYDLDIIEESMNENKREMEFATMTELEKADPSLQLSPTWRKKKIEKISSISYEDREKIIKEIADAQQAQQQQAAQQQQEQMNLEKAKAIMADKGNQVGVAK
jgi:hypothetical protein